MDVPDAGYRHIARCQRLESLILMYCRETTDAATEHIGGHDDSQEILRELHQDHGPHAGDPRGNLFARERSAHWIVGVTNAGIAAMARLPNLRELGLDGLHNVTPDVVTVFPRSTSACRYSAQ